MKLDRAHPNSIHHCMALCSLSCCVVGVWECVLFFLIESILCIMWIIMLARFVQVHLSVDLHVHWVC